MAETGRFKIFLVLSQVLLFSIIVAHAQTTSTTSSNSNAAVTVVTNDATSITSTAGALNGTINLNGSVAAAWFEWGTTTSLGTRTAAQVFQDGTGAKAFASTLTNLKPNTTYYFRAVGYRSVPDVPNALGDIKHFTTAADSSDTNSTHATLTVTTMDATSIGSNGVVLNGSVNPGSGAGAWFEWGTTTSLGTRTDVQTFNGTTTISFKQQLGSLQPKTTYYFRAVAYNATTAAAGVGEVKTFTTLEGTSTTTDAVSTTPPQKIPEVESGQIKSGYVVITPDSGAAAPIPTLTFGLVSNGLVQSQAAVIPSPLTTDASMYVEVIPSINRNIGLAIVNSGDAVNAVALTLRDEDGNLVGTTANISIAAHSQVSKFLNELFTSDVIGKGIRGSIRLQAAAPIGVVGFRFSGSVFSTVAVAVTAPVAGVPAMTLNAGTSTNTPLPGTIGGTSGVLIPQFALSGGWASQIALVNNTSAVMSGRIDVFDPSGNPMAVKLNGQTQSTFTYSIGVGGTFILAPRDSNGQSPL